MKDIFQRKTVKPSNTYLADLQSPAFYVPTIKEHAFCLAKDKKALWKVGRDALAATSHLVGESPSWGVLECQKYEILGYNLLSYEFLIEFDDALLLVVLSSEDNSRLSCVISLKYFYPLPPKAAQLAFTDNAATDMYRLYVPFSEFCVGLP